MPETTTTTSPELTLDLQIVKTGEVTTTLDDGDGTGTAVWTLVISHSDASQRDAIGATVSDEAPDGMTFVSVESADLDCEIDDDGEELSCESFDLALGESVSVLVTATYTEAQTFTNVAEVEVDGDTVESNNEDDAEVEDATVLGVEILPETGFELSAPALLASLLLAFGAALVLGARFRASSDFRA